MSEKAEVAKSSAIASLALTGIKLVVGVLSGSLALQAEAIHSGVDFFATLITWGSVRLADRPADQTHNYGHDKIENLSAFTESIILFATVVWIIRHAFEEFTAHPAALSVRYLPWAFVVVVLSIVVDIWRSVTLKRAANTYHSDALHADALHFTTDLVSSCAVLIGLIAAYFGGPRYWWADPIAALGVALVMVFIAFKLMKGSVDVLIDRAPEGLEDAMQNTIRRVPGVCDVPRVRARQAGAKMFVDATITVDPKASLEHGHQIASSVEWAATEQHKDMDITIHVEPAEQNDSINGVIYELAKTMNLPLHALRIRDINGRLYVNFHLEFPPMMPLSEAHQLVSTLENRIKLRLPEVAEIDSHLEPVSMAK